jgi:hypothetical protein
MRVNTTFANNSLHLKIKLLRQLINPQLLKRKFHQTEYCNLRNPTATNQSENDVRKRPPHPNHSPLPQPIPPPSRPYPHPNPFPFQKRKNPESSRSRGWANEWRLWETTQIKCERRRRASPQAIDQAAPTWRECGWRKRDSCGCGSLIN